MAQQVLITMQVTTQNTALGGHDIEERLAEVIRECFDADADHATISVQPYDPDAADDLLPFHLSSRQAAVSAALFGLTGLNSQVVFRTAMAHRPRSPNPAGA